MSPAEALEVPLTRSQTILEAQKPGYQDRNRKQRVLPLSETIKSSFNKRAKPIPNQDHNFFQNETDLTCSFFSKEDEIIDFSESQQKTQEILSEKYEFKPDKPEGESLLESQIIAALSNIFDSHSQTEGVMSIGENHFDYVRSQTFDSVCPPELNAKTCFGNHENAPDFLIRLRKTNSKKAWKELTSLNDFYPLFFIEAKGTQIGVKTEKEEQWQRQTLGYCFYILLMLMKVYRRKNVEDAMGAVGKELFWGLSVNTERIAFIGIRIGFPEIVLEYTTEIMNTTSRAREKE